jgi:hypothetical protein
MITTRAGAHEREGCEHAEHMRVFQDGKVSGSDPCGLSCRWSNLEVPGDSSDVERMTGCHKHSSRWHG